jgi:hypothetical protein
MHEFFYEPTSALSYFGPVHNRRAPRPRFMFQPMQLLVTPTIETPPATIAGSLNAPASNPPRLPMAGSGTAEIRERLTFTESQPLPCPAVSPVPV